MRSKVAFATASGYNKTRRLGSRRRVPFLFSLPFQQSDLLDAGRIGRTHVATSGHPQCIVDKTPFARIHRLKLKRTAGDAHAISEFSNALHDAIFAHGTVVFAIDDDFLSVFVLACSRRFNKNWIASSVSPSVQSTAGSPRYKSAASHYRLHSWSPRFARRNRGNLASCRADLSASSSFSL